MSQQYFVYVVIKKNLKLAFAKVSWVRCMKNKSS